MFSVFCKVRFPIPKTKKEKSPGDERKLFLFKCRQKIWGFFSPLNFLVQLPHLSAGERTGCGLFSITFLKDTSAEPRSARGTHLRARELPVLRELGERRATSFPESQSQSSCVGLEPGEAEPFCSRRRVPPPLPASLPACLPAGRVFCAALVVLLCCSADRGINRSRSLGSPGRTPGRRESASAMGQLCCFPFSRDEEKISKCDLFCATS